MNPNDFESPYNTGVTIDGQPDLLQPRTMASQIPPNVDSSGRKMDLMQRVDEAQDVNNEPVAGTLTNEVKEGKGIKKTEKSTFVPCDKLWYVPSPPRCPWFPFYYPLALLPILLLSI